MRTLALAALLALAACANEDPDLTTYPDVSGLYDATGSVLACPNADATTGDPAGTAASCEWSCFAADDRDVRWVKVDFARASTSDAWAVEWTTFDFGACD